LLIPSLEREHLIEGGNANDEQVVSCFLKNNRATKAGGNRACQMKREIGQTGKGKVQNNMALLSR